MDAGAESEGVDARRNALSADAEGSTRADGGGETETMVVSARDALANAIRDATLIARGGGAATNDANGDANDEMEDANEGREVYQGRLVSALVAAEHGAPTAALFVIVFVYLHCAALAFVAWLTYASRRMNAVTQACVSARDERKLSEVVTYASLVIGHVVVIWWLTPSGRRARQFFRTGAESPSFITSLLDVFVLDSSARFVFILLKLVVVALPLSTLQKLLRARGRASGATSPKVSAVKMPPARLYRRRASLLSMIEYASLMVRSLVPVSVWLAYFQRELPKVLASIITGLYLLTKSRGLVRSGSDFVKAVSAWLSLGSRSSANGEIATREDLMEAGDVCAICQEKCVDAIKLRCSHIFCDDCIGEWFDRQPSRGASGLSKTCPTCRAVVQSGVQRSYGNGASSLLPILF